MTVALIVSLVLVSLFNATLAAARLRRLKAARALADGYRDHLMTLMEDNAKLVALNNRLLGLSVKLVTDADSRSVILPPPGGLVA